MLHKAIRRVVTALGLLLVLIVAVVSWLRV